MDSKPRILITGGTGYIGSSVTKFLSDNGFRVEVVPRFYDIESIFIMFQPEIVLHFATHFSNNDDIDDVKKFIDSNIYFSTIIAHFSDKYKIKTFVNFTTFQLHYKDQEYNPVNLYAATKKAFMDILEYYHQSGKFKVVNVELNSVYGPWDKRPKLLPNLLKLIKSQSFLEKVSLTSPDKVVDLVHIDFVCNRILDIVYGLFKYDYMTISGTLISMFELVKMIENISKVKLNVEFNSVKKINREMMVPYKQDQSDWYYTTNVKDDRQLLSYLRLIIQNEEYYANLS
jgi:CDP-paratose synthetase